jgi:hypothetical protein
MLALILLPSLVHAQATIAGNVRESRRAAKTIYRS